MKINNSINTAAGLTTEKAAAEKNNTSKTESKTDKGQVDAKSTENVTLSPLSAQMKSIEATVASAKVFDTEKVEAIKTAIESGQFKVDSEKVADGLIATVKDLLNTQKS